MFNIFPYVFQTTFNTLMNSDFIDSIIDSVLNNETVNNMINEIENMTSLDINLSEREKEYIISGRLPGVKKSDIDVDYNNNYVTIKVKRNQFFSNGQNFSVTIIGPENEEIKDFYVGNVDPYSIKAVFKDNLLTVHVPKKNKIDDKVTIINVDYTVK
ncbi:Hsp20 family protein [uncultured Clostridium sp.]|uniref:Hsp20 family protein n=1 Tax=uncultured Clostridium sp. TaxID=59620 RepID=UPI0026735EB3|nr:Hsp20 family protein [uncultured Clostridium sp.]